MTDEELKEAIKNTPDISCQKCAMLNIYPSLDCSECPIWRSNQEICVGD